MTDDKLGVAVDEVLEQHEEHFQDYKDGEDGAINFLVGQVIEICPECNPKDAHQLIMAKADGDALDD